VNLLYLTRSLARAEEWPPRSFWGTALTLAVRVLPALLLLAQGRICHAGPVSKEYQLKAAFLYNFAKFVEWPPQSFASADSPIVIAVLGNSPFGDELQKAVAGRKINGRAIVVRSAQSAGAARGAQLLFVSAAEDGRFGDFRDAVGEGVLIVGESDACARRGGIIIFTLDGDKLRFEINMASATQSGLKISAQLQKLASAIHR
jgi:hypothetical protein